jgi:ribonuclease HI
MTKPHPRPPRTDAPGAQLAPVTQVAIAISPEHADRFRYHAVGQQQHWSGTVEAPTKEAALLDAMAGIRAEAPELDRVQFLVSLQAKSPLWRYSEYIAAVLPGASVARPGVSGLPLLAAAKAALAPLVVPPPQSDTALYRPCTTRAPRDLSPLTVATDGSVRGSFTGYGWLACNGQYGLHGLRHSKLRHGTKVVLISELRAIGDAVRTLSDRPLMLVSDSTLATQLITRWMNGDDVLPLGYTTERAGGKPAALISARQLIYANRRRLAIRWARGHQGEPLNEGADALARLAGRHTATPGDLTPGEYQRRAAGIADAFAQEFNRLAEVGRSARAAS